MKRTISLILIFILSICFVNTQVLASNINSNHKKYISTLDIKEDFINQTTVTHSFIDETNNTCTIILFIRDKEEYYIKDSLFHRTIEKYYLSTFNLLTGELIQTNYLGVLDKEQIEIDPQNKFLAIYDEDITVYLINPFIKVRHIELEEGYKWVKKDCKLMCFSNDFQYLAFATNDSNVSIYSLNDDEIIMDYNCEDNYKHYQGYIIVNNPIVKKLYFNPDNSKLFINYTVMENSETHHREFDELIMYELDTSLHSNVDNTYYPWELHEDMEDFISTGAFQNGSLIFLPNRDEFILDLEFHFIVYDNEGKIKKQVYSPTFNNMCGHFEQMDFTEDFSKIIIGYGTKYLVIYDTESLEIISEDYIGESMYNIIFFEDENILIGGYDQMWEANGDFVGKNIVYDLDAHTELERWNDFTLIYCSDKTTKNFLAKTKEGTYEIWQFVR